MGFLKPDLPVVDYAEWSKGTRAEKIRPMARHWAEVGFGTPVVLHLFYVVKILMYILGGWLFALATKGIDGFTNVGSWWAEPIVFQKVVLYTMLFEVVGLGCGFGPLNNRFFPPMGSILYWLRPSTIRLPPWPGRVPLTKGTNRTPIDVALYAALLVMTAVSPVLRRHRADPGSTPVGVLPVWQIATILGLLAVCGLRDKVIFLAARGEVYAALTVTFLFAGVDMIVAAKVVFVVIWMGAATSKLNKHFPFVVSTMMSNSPVIRPRFIKRMFFEKFPDDLRPGRLSRFFAHRRHRRRDVRAAGAVLLPRRLATAIAAFVMVCFHLGDPVGDPDGGAAGVERVHDLRRAGAVRRPRRRRAVRPDNPCRCVLFVVIAGTVIAGKPVPAQDLVPARACGTTPATGTPRCGASSRRPTEKIDNGIVAIASMPQAQMERFYGSKEAAQIYLYMGYAFRGVQHSRPRACSPWPTARWPATTRTTTSSPTASGSAAPRSAGTSATATCTTSN